jgi:hypothetical protein
MNLLTVSPKNIYGDVPSERPCGSYLTSFQSAEYNLLHGASIELSSSLNRGKTSLKSKTRDRLLLAPSYVVFIRLLSITDAGAVFLLPRQKCFVHETGCFNNVDILKEILRDAKTRKCINIVQLDIFEGV